MSHADGMGRCYFAAVIDVNSFETNLKISQNLDDNIVKIEAELEKLQSKLFFKYDTR